MQHTLFLFIMGMFSCIMAGNQSVYHVPIQGTIDMGLPYYLERVIDQAESEEQETDGLQKDDQVER